MEFNFTVRGDRIIADKEYRFVEGNKGYYEAEFDFGKDEIWLTGAKICVVENDDKVFEIPVINNTCILPEMLRGSAKIGVFCVVAEDEESIRASTNMVSIGVFDGASGAEVNSEMSTAAEIWEKYLSDMEENRVAAEKARDDAVSASESAEVLKNEAVSAKEVAVSAADSARASSVSAFKSSEEAAKWSRESDGSSIQASTAAGAAQKFSEEASAEADRAREKAENILNMTVSAEGLPPGNVPQVRKEVNNDGTFNLHYLIPKGEKGEKGAQGEQGPQGNKGDKGDKGDSYVLTEADKNNIKNDVSTEIETELNEALLEIIALQEELMTPDGDGVKY